MFKIIGSDNKEYGPITADQINAWILEGRANGQTLALAQGSNEWKPLSSFAEFATALGLRSAAAGPPSLMESKDPSALASAVLAKNVSVDIGQCLRRGWKSLVENIGLFLATAGLLVAMRLALGFIPLIGGIANWILYGALYGGFYLIFLHRVRGQPANVGELFAGFSQNFTQLLLAGIVSQLLISIGMIFCVVPGIYLAVAWRFSLPLVMDKGIEFWPALETSRRVLTRYWFQIFGLLIIAFLPCVLVTIYLTFRLIEVVARFMSAVMDSGHFDFGQLASLTAGFIPLVVAQQVLMFLSLPFATASLMHAYEDLFGSRPAAAA
jgi:hypothetical protein